jgi:hypothetical protein
MQGRDQLAGGGIHRRSVSQRPAAGGPGAGTDRPQVSLRAGPGAGHRVGREIRTPGEAEMWFR